ncbi:MAG: PKD domain-containing protein [Bacteroidota bacterium]|nr:PKD domain-containing protein [Bacteroidota bacterium]
MFLKLKNIILLLIFLSINFFVLGENLLIEHDSSHSHKKCNNHFQSGIKFLENKGQWKQNVLFKANIPDGFLFIEKNILTYYFYDGEALSEYKHHPCKEVLMKYHVIKIELLNSNKNISIEKKGKSPEYYNFFLGNDKSKWASGVKAFFDIKLTNIYEGIDLELFSESGNFKYNFIVHENGNPLDIQLKYSGADKLELIENELHINTSLNEFIEILPIVYQIDGDKKENIPCIFFLENDILSFDFPMSFDPKLPMIIDPVVIFSTFSGSWADNFGYSATYDDSGYAYSSGTVFFDSFPVTPGAFQEKWGGGVPSNNPSSGEERDIGILKYTPDGTQLVYATYLGGNGNEDPHSMVATSNCELIVFGNTSSDNFPIGQKSYDSTFNGKADIIVARFSNDGKQLLASTYIGGSKEDALNGYFTLATSYYNQSKLGYNYGDIYRGEVNIDKNNNVYIATTTKSTDFPTTSNSFQKNYGGGLQDACVLKLSADLDNLEYCSYIGGSNDDAGYGIVLTQNEDLYVCGGTRSTDLPVTSNKFQTSFQGGISDGFIYYISKDFSSIKSATYFGTNKYDQTYLVQTDQYDNVYVTGQTKSDTSFLIKNVNYYKYKGKQFITKLNSGLDSIIFSTVFGSGRYQPDLSPTAFLIDRCERVYFSGWGGETNHVGYNLGYTTNLPISPDAPQKTTDGSDFYLAVFARNIDTLLYATYWGDPYSHDHVDGGTSRFDKKGVIYEAVCAGCGVGASSQFPTTPNAWSNTDKGHRPPIGNYYSPLGCNNAIFKIDLDIPDIIADFQADTIFCLRDSTKITNKSYGAESYIWDFGNGDTSHAYEPNHFYKDTGLYKVTLIAINLFSCHQRDTVSKYVRVYDQSESDFTFSYFICNNHVKFEGSSKYSESYYWNFNDTLSDSNNYCYQQNTEHIFSDTGNYLVTLITDSGSVCENVTKKLVNVEKLPYAGFEFEIDTCEGKAIFHDSSVNAKNIKWLFGDNDSSSLNNPIHYYQSVDTFDIIQIAEPNSVCADTIEKRLIIITPKADIKVKLDTCNYFAEFINPSEYIDTMSIWYLGNDDTIKHLDSFFYQFDTAGIYEITLIANMGTLCLDTVIKQLIIPPLPEAEFVINRKNCSPFVKFDNQSLYSTSQFWNFGNKDSSILKSPDSIKYDTSGDYTVMLISMSKENCVDTIFHTVHIDHIAKADFDFKSTLCETAVEFTNKSTKTGKYFWDFGNNDTFTKWNPGIYDFDSAGNYPVKLIVVDKPCSDTIEKIIQVNEPPEIDFIFTKDVCTPIVVFSSNAEGIIDNRVLWDFGDSNYNYSENISYVYNESGSYQVTFTINYDTICTAKVTKEILVTDYQNEKIIIPNIFTPNGDGVNDIFKIKGLNFDCDIYKLKIFNRWGQKVFESKGENMDWDGTTKGILVSEGTYYYVFESSLLTQAGTITVVY